MIQSFSSLITEKIMKTIIPYRWIIEDAVNIHKSKNPNFQNLTDQLHGENKIRYNMQNTHMTG